MARRMKTQKAFTTITGMEVKESHCTKCMETKRASDFYQALDLYTHRNGLSHLCKSCEREIYDDLLKEFRNIPDSLGKYCQIVNIPYDEEMSSNIYKLHMEQDRNGKRKKHPVSLYNQYIKTKFSDRNVGGEFYSLDLTFSQETSRKYRNEFEDDSSVENEFWGGKYSEEEIDFLENQYHYFKETTAIENHTEVMYLKRICKKLLYLRQAEEDSDYKLIGSLEKELKSLTDTLGISPDKAQAAKSGKVASSFGVWIKTIEKFTPAEWLENEGKPLYKDVDGIERYGYNFITRSVENFLKGEFNSQIMGEDGEIVDGGI